MFNKKVIFLLAIVAGTIISLSYYYSKSNAKHTVGWETTKSAQQPFKPGIITNGQPPADFEISLIEPKIHSPINLRPAESSQFLVNIKILDTNSPNSDTPPTFVILKIINGNKVLSDVTLTPSAKTERNYTYSGQIAAPGKIGDYEVVLEAEYAIYDNSGDKGAKRKRPQQFHKSIKGVILHVSN
jgi:hypothetical protein